VTDQELFGPARRPARPARARKAAVAIAQSIVDEITDRGHPPGTKLPAEHEMVSRFGVGRATLRESLRFLELNGIIMLKPGPSGGPVVMAPDARNLAGILGLFLQLHPTPFSVVVEAREILEPITARMAAGRVDEETLRVLKSSIEGMVRYIDDEEAFLIENERFHEAVATASGNTLFSLLISSMHLITDGMQIGVTYPLKRRRAVLKAHEAIYAAIAAGDPDTAEESMRRHMAEFRRYVERNFAPVYEKRLRWSDVAP
jgi:GntR family transcriptional regulator, transcriptional repressor for pyruvate dehydrogenase complex